MVSFSKFFNVRCDFLCLISIFFSCLILLITQFFTIRQSVP